MSIDGTLHAIFFHSKAQDGHLPESWYLCFHLFLTSASSVRTPPPPISQKPVVLLVTPLCVRARSAVVSLSSERLSKDGAQRIAHPLGGGGGGGGQYLDLLVCFQVVLCFSW